MVFDIVEYIVRGCLSYIKKRRVLLATLAQSSISQKRIDGLKN